MSRLSLPDKVVSVAAALRDVPHAFGGALALAYYAEPRATIDIDLNVFVTVADEAHVFERLATCGVVRPGDCAKVLKDAGQIRVAFDGTPLDLFFSYDPFHEAAALAREVVPFSTVRINVLSASHLVVCKAVFSRPKDWVDIDAMVEHEAPIDLAEVMKWVGRIVGDEDRRYRRVAEVLSGR